MNIEAPARGAMRPAAACDWLGCSRDTFDRLWRDGHLKTFKIGAARFVTVAELEVPERADLRWRRALAAEEGLPREALREYYEHRQAAELLAVRALSALPSAWEVVSRRWQRRGRP